MSGRILLKIDIGEDDVHIVGICGIGGIGKTSLAKVVYNQMYLIWKKQLFPQILFDGSFSFFNVYEGNAVISHMLSHKKIFVLMMLIIYNN
ncbi:hypothetical protein CXB51_029941 [Gossypium anomalum]|uniref:NB-ARC domain-containing protein n=1 Tax=Gossypium anomalum TaxID=47600 RepID=A0A8J5Z055_9ROSI|nr:hypothetical protein CXB51_029941 [Gossypium anomalum]